MVLPYGPDVIGTAVVWLASEAGGLQVGFTGIGAGGAAPSPQAGTEGSTHRELLPPLVNDTDDVSAAVPDPCGAVVATAVDVPPSASGARTAATSAATVANPIHGGRCRRPLVTFLVDRLLMAPPVGSLRPASCMARAQAERQRPGSRARP